MFPSSYFAPSYFPHTYFPGVSGTVPVIYPFLYPPSVPTAAPGTNTDQAASCAFVSAAISGLGGSTFPTGRVLYGDGDSSPATSRDLAFSVGTNACTLQVGFVNTSVVGDYEVGRIAMAYTPDTAATVGIFPDPLGNVNFKLGTRFVTLLAGAIGQNPDGSDYQNLYTGYDTRIHCFFGGEIGLRAGRIADGIGALGTERVTSYIPIRVAPDAAARVPMTLVGASGQTAPLLDAAGRVHFDARYSSWHAFPAPISGTITLDWAVGDRWHGTLPNGPTAFAFSNVPPAGSSQVLLLRVTQPASGAAGTVTWPSGTNPAPALSTTNGATDILSVSNDSGGSTYDVVLVSQAVVAGIVPVDNAPATIYVATTGSDTTGNGTSGSPYATIAKAISVLPDLLLIDHAINVADGTYAEGIDIRRFLGRGDLTLTISGNVATPANVTFTGTLTNPYGVTCGAYVACMARVTVRGITLDVTATHGVVVDLGARLVVDRCTITAPTSEAISDAAIDVINRSFVEFRGNCTLSNWASNGIGAYTDSLVTYTVAGTLTITRPDSAGNGIHLAYGAAMVCQTAGTNISISGARIGWQLGLHARFQHIGASSTLSASNGSTPSPSSGVQATDLSSWSTPNTVNLTHFAIGFEATSISYVEAIGTRNLSNVTTPSSATQNSVVLLP